MQKRIYICENCGQRTDSYYDELGWIHISNRGLTISGSPETGNRCERFSSIIRSANDNDSVDFCCWRCFLEYLYTSRNTDNYTTEEPVRKRNVDKFLKLIYLDQVISSNK